MPWNSQNLPCKLIPLQNPSLKGKWDMVKFSYAKSFSPELKFCQNERDLMWFKKWSVSLEKCPSISESAISHPYQTHHHLVLWDVRRGLEGALQSHLLLDHREIERWQRKSKVKDPDTDVLCVASKAVNFPRQETIPIWEKKATEKVPSYSVEIAVKKRICLAKEWLHLS